MIDLLVVIAFVDDPAFFIHDSEALELLELGLEGHVVRELVLEQQVVVDLAHGTEGAQGCRHQAVD